MTTAYGERDGWPEICGREPELQRIAGSRPPAAPPGAPADAAQIRAACAIALHMHQPLIPAGGGDLASAPIISNLQHMMEHQHIGDNHNAPVFHWCYKRMGEIGRAHV